MQDNHVNDHFVKQAKKFGYRSRASFKILEIHQRFNIFKKGFKVLELGAAPGGWTQVAVKYTESKSKNPTVLALDRDSFQPLEGAKIIKGDIYKEESLLQIPEFFEMNPVDVVLSDMAPNFSGDLESDHLGIVELNERTLQICEKFLKNGGTLVMKSLQGSTETIQFEKFKIYFKEFQRVKPQASRQTSRELFYLGRGFKLNDKYQKKKLLEKKIVKSEKLKAEKSEEIIDESIMSKEEQIQYIGTLRNILQVSIEIQKPWKKSDIESIKDIEALKDIQWELLRIYDDNDLIHEEWEPTEQQNYKLLKAQYGDQIQIEEPRSIEEKILKAAELQKEYVRLEKSIQRQKKNKKTNDIKKNPVPQKDENSKDEALFLEGEDLLIDIKQKEQVPKSTLEQKFEEALKASAINFDADYEQDKDDLTEKGEKQRIEDSKLGDIEDLKHKILNFEQYRIKQLQEMGINPNRLENSFRPKTYEELKQEFQEKEENNQKSLLDDDHSREQFLSELRDNLGKLEIKQERQDKFEQVVKTSLRRGNK